MAKLKYHSALFFVEDVEKSKHFYSKVLEQKIATDLGRYVGFEGGFGIWKRDYALERIFSEKADKIAIGKNSAELYFEANELDEIYNNLKEKNVKFVHHLREQPWGQRVFRIYDPDRCIIEIGEPMEAVILRYHRQGMSLQEIIQKTTLPEEEVKQILNGLQ